MDIPLVAACQDGRLPVLKANAVAIDRDDEAGLVVEWLQYGNDGRLSIVATRSIAAGQSAIPVVPSPDRLIRFSRGDSSPVTASAAELTRGERWRLPSSTTGGELIVRRERAPIVPETYRVALANGRVIEPRRVDDFFLFGSLPEGGSVLTPIYEGGIAGRRQRVRIQAGRSVALFAAAEDVGGIVIDIVDSTICSDAERIRIRTAKSNVTTSAAGIKASIIKTIKDDVVQISKGLGCQRTVAGLVPGDYEVELLAQDNHTITARSVRTESGTLSAVVVQSMARLSGRVTLNGRPITTGTLEFLAAGDTRPVAQAGVNNDGTYSVNFKAPGDYTVRLRRHGALAPGESQVVKVLQGENAFDVAIAGVTLTVKVENIDAPGGRDIRVMVYRIRPPVVNGRPGSRVVIEGDDPDVAKKGVVVDALTPGEYTVRASQAARSESGLGRSSEDVTVTLTDANPEATVTLRLSENTGTLIVTDSSGVPVQGTSVYRLGVRPREIRTGTFVLDGVPPGFPLNIRATGHTPLCRRVPANTTTTVVLDRGRAVEVRFVGVSTAMSSPWGHLSWPGTDCAIALDAFPFVKLPSDTDGVQRFMVSHFPRADDVLIGVDGGAPQNLRVTGDLLSVAPKR